MGKLRLWLLVLCLTIGVVARADAEPQLMLFGGPDHDMFLGCLNCNQHVSTSVWNAYGAQGSPYGSSSIFNEYGPYGSPYSSTSPWNPNASNPPVIVDNDGQSYGYFTANTANPKRKQIVWIVWLLDHSDYVFKNLDTVREKFG
jgi:hypothetical protein